MAYDTQDKAMTDEAVHTAGPSHHIALVPNHTRLAANSQGLACVTARVEDAQSNLCLAATNEPHMQVSGAGRFCAVGNGDATCLELLFHQPQMHAFSGQLMAMVQATTTTGELRSPSAPLPCSRPKPIFGKWTGLTTARANCPPAS